MFVALVLSAVLGDPVGRVQKPVSAKVHVPGRVEWRADPAGPGATAL